MAYNKKQKLQDNIAAIRTVLQLEKEGRTATEAEREVLKKYSGFGGLKFVLNDVDVDNIDNRDIESWKKSDRKYYNQTRELYETIREGARDEKEAKELTDSIKRSVNTAFYTPQPVIDTIVKVMKDAGVEVRSMLDPSAGIGKFGDAFKAEYPDVKVSAFEKDLLTGRILKALNPQDSITIDGFETIMPELKGTFDVAASNIPFGDIKVLDDEYRKSGNDAKRYAISAIHNYFFMKSLDMVREGGFVAFITSRGFMDSPANNIIREEISKNARFVGAFRLPDGMFRDEAGTDVGSDLVVLQKYTNYDKSLDPDTLAFCEVSNGYKAMSGEDWTDISLNSHWWKSLMAPDAEAFISTKMERGTDPYGKPTLVFTHEGGMEGITKLLAEYFKRDLYSDFVEYYKAHAPKIEAKNAPKEKEDIMKEPAQAQSPLTVQPQVVAAQPKVQSVAQSAPVQLDLFSLWEADESGVANPVQQPVPQQTEMVKHEKPSLEPRPYDSEQKPFYRDGMVIEDKASGQLGVISTTAYYPKTTMFSPLNLNRDQEGRMRQYIPLRDTYQELYNTEAESRQAQPWLRKELNRLYDEYVGKYGALNERKNAKIILMDGMGRDVLALENAQDKAFVKADIFERPVSFVAYEISHVDTAEDALFASLNRYGVVDLEYMAGLTGSTENTLIDQLKGRIYYNPIGNPDNPLAYDTAEHFLSGNVYEKLDRLQAFYEDMQETMPDSPLSDRVKESVNALEQALPQQIAFDDIGLQFGERWIPTSYYEDYLGKVFDTKMEIHYAENIDEYTLAADDRYNLKIREEYCVRGEYRDYDGMALLAHAFHNTTPDIQKCIGYDEDGKDLKGPDMEKIQLANSKIDEIRDGFAEYLTNLPREKRDELQQMYNRKFNCFVKAKYDGSHQTFPGIDMKALGSSRFNIKDIYKSQKDCVWMLLQNGGGICDHEVGTGKTLIMCMAAHEMHRLGLANKPMIIALKANVAEIAATYQAAFPDDKILYASEKDFSPANRSKFFNNIKNNDYACVVMSHDQFGKIPQSMDIQRQILDAEIRDIDEALDVLRNEGGNISGRMLTGLEKRKENMKVQLMKLQHDIEQRKDDFVDFGMMGIDHIFVDESHQFKNLTFTTRHQRVSGLGNPAGSQKALNLLYAIRTIQNRTGRDLGATFLSGTTISNSLTELYLLFKYLRPKAMAQQGIHSFDAWAAVYAKKTSDYEFSVTNAVVQKERFRYFVKVPELATFYNEITDYRTGEDVGLDRPAMNVVLHNIKPTADQRDFNERLMQFAQTGDGELIFRAPLNDREQKGKMLIATDASRKASLDMRLVDQDLFDDDPDNKASHCARLVSEYYRKYNEQKGTQFIFSDLSTYKPGEWNVFTEIKRKLVEDYNIPESEVRFIQEAKNEKQRKELIKAMNEGTVRVLFGSTSTLGTGVNAQKRAVAVHHIDIPWRPSDLEQRDGRARRTGNEVAKLYADNNVDVIIYAVERTLDSYKFNLLQNKQLFISQLKTNSLGTRVIDEGAMDEENGMNFAEYVAILSGNDDLLQKAKLEKKIMALESERQTYMQARRETEWRLESAQEKVQKNEAVIQNMTEDYDKFQSLAKKGEDGQVLPGLTMPKVKEFDATGAYNIEGMGDALQDAGRTIGNKDRQMGEVYGFPLIVDSIYMWDDKMKKDVYAGNKFYLQGHYQYEYNNGKLAMSKDNKLAAVRYGVNALERIPGYIRQYQERNAKLKQDIAEYQRIAGKAWGKEDDLKDLKKEMEVLDKKIQEGLDAQTKNMPKPKVEPYKLSKEGRYHTVTFPRDAYPLVSIKEMREFADTGSWRNRGFVRCGHWDGDMMVSDPEVTAEFTLRRKAEEFIQEVVNTNDERQSNTIWLVAKAKDDTNGDIINQDNEVIFAARQVLEERGINWQHPMGGIHEGEGELSETQQDMPLIVYSLGRYGVGERGENLRTLAHQVKEVWTDDIITDAANQLSGIFKNLPYSERERMILVPMPGHDGFPGYTDDIAYEIGEKLDMSSSNGLICSSHPSLYELKKENGIEDLPDIEFTFNGNLEPGTIVVLVDNVLDTGHTLSQAMNVDFGKGVEVRAAVLAHTDNYLQYHPEIEVKDINVLRQERKGIDVNTEDGKIRIAAQLQDTEKQKKGFDEDNQVRDALIELLRTTGIEVIADKAVGQQVLEQAEGNVRFMRMPDSPVFISNARRAVENIAQEKATPAQWLRMIQKNGGLKVAEDRWMGLSDWLRGSTQLTLTRNQVLEYIAENEIKVEEVQYEAPGNHFESTKLDQMNEEFFILMDEAEERLRVGELSSGMATGSIYIDDYARWAFDQLTERYGEEFRQCTDLAKDYNGWHLKPFEHYEGDGPTTRASAYYGLNKTIYDTRLSYVTDGLENNREIALTVPTIESWGAGDTLHFGDAGDGRAIAWVRFGETTNDNERVLVVDEIQSKRHQEGRTHGYITKDIQNHLDRMDTRIQEAIFRRDEYHAELRAKYGQERPKEFTIPQIRQLNAALEKMITKDEREKYQFLDNRVKDRQTLREVYRQYHGLDSRSVPAAPFERTWQELAMKRILRFAAENGYDRVAWTTGLQQAERYNLGNVVQNIKVSPYQAGSSKEENGFDVDIAYNSAGNTQYLTLFVTKDGVVSANDHPELHNKHLSEVVGKALAEKILSVSEPDTDISGEDLRIGIEGMQAFYDHIIPSFVNSYGKKWDVHTEDVCLPKLGDGGLVMHSIRLNDQMKEDMRKAQPMFFKTDQGEAYGFVYDNKIYIDPAIATAETPIHEYTHLWAEVLREGNPKEWAGIVQMMKETPDIWNHVKEQYPSLHTDDEIAEESLAQYSGQRGYQRLRDAVEGKENGQGIFEKISEALVKFWKAVADFLHIHYHNKEEVADRVLYDLLNGVNPLKYMVEKNEQPIQGLEDYDRKDVEQQVEDFVNGKLQEDFPEEDIYVKQVTVVGSRSRGEAHEGSDLDILLEYGGEGVREDTLFNILNEDRLEIGGIRVDINPINEKYSMNTAQWLERDARWREADRQLAQQHLDVTKGFDELGQTDLPMFLVKEAERVLPDTHEVETYTAVSVDPPYIMLYEGMEDARQHLGAMMLTDFPKDVQRQVLTQLSETLEESRVQKMQERVSNQVKDLGLDYMPLSLPSSVVVNEYDDGNALRNLEIGFVMFNNYGVDVFENREDAYDNRHGITLDELPKETRQQVYEQVGELLSSEDRQLTVQVDTKQVPDYALPAIINGDFSNLDAEETELVQEFMGRYPNCIFSYRDVSPSFESKPAFGKTADCVPVDIVRVVTIKQLREEKAQQDQKKQLAEEKEKAEKKEAKEKKKDETPAVVTTAALLISALELARANNGVWLNRCGNLSKEVVQQSRLMKPFDALTMVLQADTKGECPKEEAKKESAMYKQARELKEKHPDAMILMRNGDSYEMIDDDAERGARILGLALSTRTSGKSIVPYTEFPHRALDTYLPKLVRAGLRVAICDALDDNTQQKKQAEGIYKEADALVKAIQKQDDKVQVNPLLETEYDYESKGLCFSNSRKSAYGKEVETASVRVNDIYRAAIAYTGAEDRLNRVGQSGLSAVDAQKYDRLVAELAAGVIMARQGLSAQLSKEGKELIPEWQQSLKENPALEARLERDVNNAIQVLGKLMKGETVDYAAFRGAEETAEKQHEVAIKQVLMTCDDKGCHLLYIKPEEGKSVTIYPEPADVKRFYEAYHTPEFDHVRALLGQKYYGLLQQHPDLEVQVLMPDTKGLDLSRISKVNITKDRYKENSTILFATIDGVQQKPVELNQLQVRRFWMADDKDAYKTALAANLFREKLSLSEEQAEGQSQDSQSQTSDEKEEEPRRGIHI